MGTDDPKALRARRSLLLYFAILFPVSILIETRLLLAGDSIRNHIGLVLALMWMPAVASFITRLVLREGFADVSFRFGGATGARMTLYALGYPLAIGALSYGFAWSIGLADFKVPAVPGFPNVDTPWLAFLLLVIIRSTIGVAIAAIAAAGEEIGWRGYMLTRLIDAKLPHPILLSGIIWWAWHAAMVLGGVYAAGPNRALSAVMFLVVIVAQAYFCARLRLESGSVWPAIVAHSAWNSMIQGIFDFSTADVGSGVWVGESGILVAITSVVVAWICVRGKWPKQLAPGVPLPSDEAPRS